MRRDWFLGADLSFGRAPESTPRVPVAGAGWGGQSARNIPKWEQSGQPDPPYFFLTMPFDKLSVHHVQVPSSTRSMRLRKAAIGFRAKTDAKNLKPHWCQFFGIATKTCNKLEIEFV